MKSIFETVEEYYSKPVKEEDFVTTRRLKNGHIEDRTQSVIWNEEFVKSNNEKYQAQRREYISACNEKEAQLQSDLKACIAEEKQLTSEQVDIVFSFAYQEKHSYGYHDVANFADELADVVHDILIVSK